MIRRFEIKTFDHTGTFKHQIRQLDVMSDIRFSEDLNGGQGNLTLDIVGNPNDFLCSDFVEIREISEEYLSTIATYTGIIEEIQIIQTKQVYTIRLQILGVFTLLNDVVYRSGGVKFSKTGKPGQMIEDVIDYFQSVIGGVSSDMQNLSNYAIRYTSGSIEKTYPNNIIINFDGDTCLQAIEKIAEYTGRNWYIGQDGILYYTQPQNEQEYIFTFNKDIIEFKRTFSKREMINTLFLGRSDGTIKTYQDIPMQGAYGVKEKYEHNSDIGDESGQDLKGAEMVDELKQEIQDIEMTIPYKYNIKPGDLITTQNTLNPIEKRQIERVDKRQDNMILYIGEYKSLGQTIFQ